METPPEDNTFMDDGGERKREGIGGLHEDSLQSAMLACKTSNRVLLDSIAKWKKATCFDGNIAAGEERCDEQVAPEQGSDAHRKIFK